MQDLGKMLLLVGVLFVDIGGVLVLAGRVPWLGHLPGDIVIQRDNLSCFFPIVTSIVLSILLTVVLNIILAVLRR